MPQKVKEEETKQKKFPKSMTSILLAKLPNHLSLPQFCNSDKWYLLMEGLNRVNFQCATTKDEFISNQIL